MTPEGPGRPKLDPITVARTAGLDRAVEQFPDDVLAAAQAAAQDLADVPTIDPTAEPWPPMRPRSAR
jgi:hypothetical protein